MPARAAPTRDRAAGSAASGPTWADYVQLMRLPNVFTAVADVVMGCVVARPTGPDLLPLALLVLTSACLYLGGIVLNDVFDVEVDRAERPDRPLPSGRVPLATARRLGWGLLIAGVISSVFAGLAVGWVGTWAWRPPVLAVVLAALIVGYDGLLKRTVVGPLAMGGCRLLNVLLGLSLGAIETGETVLTLGFDAWEWLIAGGMGLYVAGLTVFAKGEAGTSRRVPLVLGTALMAGGLLLLAVVPFCVTFDKPLRMTADFSWPLVLVLIAFHLVIGFRFTSPLIPALRTGRGEHVCPTVGRLLFAIPWLDAALAALFALTWAWPVAIVLLTVPRLLLSKVQVT